MSKEVAAERYCPWQAHRLLRAAQGVWSGKPAGECEPPNPIDVLMQPGLASLFHCGAFCRKRHGGSGGGGDIDYLHPFIQGLLKTLPEPETEWDAKDRAKWLQTAANIFDLIYKGEGGITVTSAMAQRSPRPSDH